MTAYAEQLLLDTARDSFNRSEQRRLLAELDGNAPMREDVLTLLAQFKVNLGPFFLRALLDRLDGSLGGSESDPICEALRIALAVPAGEICEELLAGEESR